MITTKRKELDASMMMIKAKPDDAKLFTNSWNKSTVSICLSSGLWPRTTTGGRPDRDYQRRGEGPGHNLQPNISVLIYLYCEYCGLQYFLHLMEGKKIGMSGGETGQASPTQPPESREVRETRVSRGVQGVHDVQDTKP